MRPNLYDRINQPEVRFRTDEKIKQELHRIADMEGKSLNVFLEDMVRKEIFRMQMKNK